MFGHVENEELGTPWQLVGEVHGHWVSHSPEADEADIQWTVHFERQSD